VWSGRTVLLVLCAVSLWASLWPVGVVVIVIVPLITTAVTVTVSVSVTIVWDTHTTQQMIVVRACINPFKACHRNARRA
jgi:hypothetical protein